MKLSLLTRLAGSPAGALLICLGSLVILRGWQQGQISGWWVLPVAAVLFQTLGAVRKVWQYKQWRKQWDSIGQERQEKSERVKKQLSPSHRLLRTVALSVLLMVVALALKDRGIFENEETVTGVMFGAGLLCLVGSVVWYGVTLLRRRGGKAAQSRAGGAEKISEPVAQCLNVPRLAPSRESATKNLPEYVAGLLTYEPDREQPEQWQPRAQARTQTAAEASYASPRRSEAPKERLINVNALPAFPQWAWMAGTGVIVAALLGGFALFRQGPSGKKEAPIDWDSYRTQDKQKTSVKRPPEQPHKTDQEVAEDYFKSLPPEPKTKGENTGVRPLWGAGTPAAERKPLPQKDVSQAPQSNASKMYQEEMQKLQGAEREITPEQELQVKNKLEDAAYSNPQTANNPDLQRKYLAFVQALTTRPQYRSTWTALVRIYTGPASAEAEAKRQELTNQALEQFNREHATP